MKQIELGIATSEGIDEHGAGDEWGRGGVYDADRNYDLEATQEVLQERFEPVERQLPDTVGDFSKIDSRFSYSAKYESTSPYRDENGTEVVRCVIRIFPLGPYLNSWSVGVRERREEYSGYMNNGWSSWIHSDAQERNNIGDAVATALAIMKGKIPRSRTP